MKLLKLVLLLVLAFIASGCGKSSTDAGGTITKKGLLYKIGDSEPYSGTVTGYAREGYRSRKMKYEKLYKSGIRHGDTKFWYANGKLESIEPYKNGKINGHFMRFNSDGRIKERILMANGKRGEPKRKAVIK